MNKLRNTLAPYAIPDARVGWKQVLNTLPPFLALGALMAWVYQYSLTATLLLSIPTGLFLVRLFIIQHDCGHHSLFPSKEANEILGRLLAVFTFTPYYNWRTVHNLHHATSGNLDRRSFGDIWMMTVKEYRESTPWTRIRYRIYRNPIMLFIVGPTFYFLIRRRFPIRLKPHMKKERNDVYMTDLGIVAFYGAIVWAIGWKAAACICVPVFTVSSIVGVWLFYVQHTYEDTYWKKSDEWDFYAAGLEGSSHYDLPKWLLWFTADISVHHIHHVEARIPNYKLQTCLQENPELRPTKSIKFFESLQLANLKLWDESTQRLVGFPH